MTWMNTASRYGIIAQSLHWLTAILVAAAYISSAGGPETRVYRPEMAATRLAHETLGLCVIVLVLIRLAWRFADPPPEIGANAGLDAGGGARDAYWTLRLASSCAGYRSNRCHSRGAPHFTVVPGRYLAKFRTGPCPWPCRDRCAHHIGKCDNMASRRSCGGGSVPSPVLARYGARLDAGNNSATCAAEMTGSSGPSFDMRSR